MIESAQDVIEQVNTQGDLIEVLEEQIVSCLAGK
jgi:hypothetical protein